MNRPNQILLAVCFIVMVLASTPASQGVTKDELKDRFKARHPALVAAKDAGRVGETFQGFVEAVRPGEANEDARKLVDEENGDRSELYGIIAREQGTTPEEVARLNAQRNFERAARGHYLRDGDGTWRQKQ